MELRTIVDTAPIIGKGNYIRQKHHPYQHSKQREGQIVDSINRVMALKDSHVYSIRFEPHPSGEMFNLGDEVANLSKFAFV